MRTDENLARPSFRFSPGWKEDALAGRPRPEIDRRLRGGVVAGGRYLAHSLSGNERNRTFLNRGGKGFVDLSALSGLDTPADSRGSAFWDYDRDGRTDIAVVNANDPLLALYRNRLGEAAPAGAGGFIALRFAGAKRSADPAPGKACRDGYGALVTVELEGGPTLVREHRCGEGFGAQNSATLLVGIGSRPGARNVTVRWPSGVVHRAGPVDAGTLLTAFEDPAQAPADEGSPFARTTYRLTPSPPAPPPPDDPPPTRPGQRFIPGPVARADAGGTAGAGAPPALRVYTTMATWCAACINHLPQVRHLQRTLGPEGVEFLGLPVDGADDRAKLEAYASRWDTPYRLLADLDPRERRQLNAFLAAHMRDPNPPLPSTVVTDGDGHLLLVGRGIPPASLLRKLLRGRRGDETGAAAASGE